MAVNSVNGQTGDVVLSAANVSAVPVAGQPATPTLSSLAPPANANGLNLVTLVADATNADGTRGGGVFVRQLELALDWGGSSAKGGVNATEHVLRHNSSTAPSNPDDVYVALAATAAGLSNGGDGGSAQTPRGHLYAFNAFASAAKGYTNTWNITGMEVNTQLMPGSSTRYHSVAQFAHISTVRGTVIDCVVAVSGVGGSSSRANGILIGDTNGESPVASDGNLIGTYSPSGSYSLVANNAIDLSAYNLLGNIVNHRNGSIRADGLITISVAGTASVTTGLQAQTQSVPQIDGGIYFGGGSAGTPFRASISLRGGMVISPSVVPAADQSFALGQPSRRWDGIYLSQNPVVTSDLSDKFLLERLTDASCDNLLQAIQDVGIVMFKWLSAIADKGEHAARTHVGVVAQELDAALRRRGEDPERFGFFCSDPEMVEATEEYVGLALVKEARTETESYVEVSGGRAVRKERVVVVEYPVEDEFPLFREDGTPVMTTGRPARTSTSATGEALQTSPAIAPVQKVHRVPRMRPETRTRIVSKPTGRKVLGIRYVQFLLVRLAAVERRLARLEGRAS